MNTFFNKKSTVILSVILIMGVLILNFTAQRSVNKTMVSLRHVPIARVQTDKNIVALTFNLTENDNADIILSKLGNRRATFFISREFLCGHPEKVKEIISAGHSIGLLEAQLRNVERTVVFELLSARIEETAAITGINCDLIRICQNKYDGDGINAVYALGLYPVQWSADCHTENFSHGDIMLADNFCDLNELFERIEKSGCTIAPAADLLIKSSYTVDINGTMLPD